MASSPSFSHPFSFIRLPPEGSGAKTLQLKWDGFVVTVPAADVSEVSFKCPQCGGKSEVDGLCEGCRERWLPGR